MVLIALLIAALVCVVLGVVLGSVGWLVASLVLSVLAAAALVRAYRSSRRRLGGTAPETAGGASAPTGANPAAGADTPASSDSADSADSADVLVVDGQPDYHREHCERIAGSPVAETIPLAQALEDGFAPCTRCRPPTQLHKEPAESFTAVSAELRAADATVWVADGYPEYHVGECGELAGLDAEAVPYEQALEDGFQPCVVCNPDAMFHASPTPFAPARTPDREVWVADGYPAYHREGCDGLAGLDAEPVPVDQAVEDGFTQCSVCTPDAAAGAAAVAAASELSSTPASRGDVWVVDGFPDYHREHCPTLTGMSAEPVPYAQAVEDGFQECPVCTPEAAQAPDLPATDEQQPAAPEVGDVWVVDGFPAYHRAGCNELAGLDAEPVPVTQAVEDGFTECPVCTPQSPQPSAAVGEAPDEVWVADGFPDYHRQGCPVLDGLDGEAIPRRQAVEDGFAPCATCKPEDAAAPDLHRDPGQEPAAQPQQATEPAVEVVESPWQSAPEPEAADAQPGAESLPQPLAVLVPESASAVGTSAAEPVTSPSAEAADSAAPTAAQVWVVDGRPRYHAQDCLIIKGQQAQPVTQDQAAADGFLPCSLCCRSAF